jgi:hypothetical protein
MDFPAMLDERLGSLSMFHLAIRLWGTPKTCWVNLQLLENPNYCNSTIAKCMLIGGYWRFGTFFIFFSRIDGMSSFPLTNSYLSEGWLNHQAVYHGLSISSGLTQTWIWLISPGGSPRHWNPRVTIHESFQYFNKFYGVPNRCAK